jgi:hypothetical protein
MRVCVCAVSLDARGHESWEDKTTVEYPLILATGDATGSVIVWDVLKAEIKVTMGSCPRFVP